MQKKTTKKCQKYIPYVFSTYDPLDREVILTENTWDKICTSHKEISNPDEIKNTIDTPDVITTDKFKNTTENYYRSCSETDSKKKKYTKVCVNFDETPARTLTAFRADKIHDQDKLKWKN